ncbi:MAG: F-type H+-transporting ATPase subunit b [Candidatus Promineifilaceae bacterium]|jgi:F-type H+-transporting ATPase subunit b
MADSSHDDHVNGGHADAAHGTSIEVPADSHGDASHGHDGQSLFAPDVSMVILTWVTFGIVAAVLYKIAWKPILAGLDAREGKIRQSLDDADKTAKALADIDATRAAMIVQAEKDTQAMVAAARDEAIKAASKVEAGAHEKVKIMYENAERDIVAVKNKAIVELRREQADLVLSLAGRLVTENLDTDKNRELTDRLIAELG